MAQSRAVRESAPGWCLVSDAGVSSDVDAVEIASGFGGEEGIDATEEADSISSMGFMLESIPGSFDMSSGLDKSDDRISPPPELLGGGDGCIDAGAIFCRIEDSISSCLASLRVFSFWVIIYPRLPFLKFLISSAARERSPSFAIESA